MSDEVRKEKREMLASLRKQRNELAEWSGSLKTSSAESWEHIKEGFQMHTDH